jgi:hypothetical protein
MFGKDKILDDKVSFFVLEVSPDFNFFANNV